MAHHGQNRLKARRMEQHDAQIVEMQEAQAAMDGQEGELPIVDPSGFYIPSHTGDTIAESPKLQFRVLPQYVKIAERIIAEKSLGFTTPSDLYRWCVHKGMEILTRLGRVDTDWSRINFILETLRDDESSAQFEEIITKLQDRVRAHLDRGGEKGEAEALRLVLKCRETIMTLTNEYWQNRYLHAIEEKFGGMIARGPKMSLLPLETDRDSERE